MLSIRQAAAPPVMVEEEHLTTPLDNLDAL